jgi:hypothetical protein
VRRDTEDKLLYLQPLESWDEAAIGAAMERINERAAKKKKAPEATVDGVAEAIGETVEATDPGEARLEVLEKLKGKLKDIDAAGVLALQSQGVQYFGPVDLGDKSVQNIQRVLYQQMPLRKPLPSAEGEDPGPMSPQELEYKATMSPESLTPQELDAYTALSGVAPLFRGEALRVALEADNGKKAAIIRAAEAGQIILPGDTLTDRKDRSYTVVGFEANEKGESGWRVAGRDALIPQALIGATKDFKVTINTSALPNRGRFGLVASDSAEGTLRQVIDELERIGYIELNIPKGVSIDQWKRASESERKEMWDAMPEAERKVALDARYKAANLPKGVSYIKATDKYRYSTGALSLSDGMILSNPTRRSLAEGRYDVEDFIEGYLKALGRNPETGEWDSQQFWSFFPGLEKVYREAKSSFDPKELSSQENQTLRAMPSSGTLNADVEIVSHLVTDMALGFENADLARMLPWFDQLELLRSAGLTSSSPAIRDAGINMQRVMGAELFERLRYESREAVAARIEGRAAPAERAGEREAPAPAPAEAPAEQVEAPTEVSAEEALTDEIVDSDLEDEGAFGEEAKAPPSREIAAGEEAKRKKAEKEAKRKAEEEAKRKAEEEEEEEEQEEDLGEGAPAAQFIGRRGAAKKPTPPTTRPATPTTTTGTTEKDNFDWMEDAGTFATAAADRPEPPTPPRREIAGGGPDKQIDQTDSEGKPEDIIELEPLTSETLWRRHPGITRIALKIGLFERELRKAGLVETETFTMPYQYISERFNISFEEARTALNGVRNIPEAVSVLSNTPLTSEINNLEATDLGQAVADDELRPDTQDSTPVFRTGEDFGAKYLAESVKAVTSFTKQLYNYDLTLPIAQIIRTTKEDGVPLGADRLPKHYESEKSFEAWKASYDLEKAIAGAKRDIQRDRIPESGAKLLGVLTRLLPYEYAKNLVNAMQNSYGQEVISFQSTAVVDGEFGIRAVSRNTSNMSLVQQRVRDLLRRLTPTEYFGENNKALRDSLDAVREALDGYGSRAKNVEKSIGTFLARATSDRASDLDKNLLNKFTVAFARLITGTNSVVFQEQLQALLSGGVTEADRGKEIRFQLFRAWETIMAPLQTIQSDLAAGGINQDKANTELQKLVTETVRSSLGMSETQSAEEVGITSEAARLAFNKNEYLREALVRLAPKGLLQLTGRGVSNLQASGLVPYSTQVAAAERAALKRGGNLFLAFDASTPIAEPQKLNKFSPDVVREMFKEVARSEFQKLKMGQEARLLIPMYLTGDKLDYYGIVIPLTHDMEIAPGKPLSSYLAVAFGKGKKTPSQRFEEFYNDVYASGEEPGLAERINIEMLSDMLGPNFATMKLGDAIKRASQLRTPSIRPVVNVDGHIQTDETGNVEYIVALDENGKPYKGPGDGLLAIVPGKEAPIKRSSKVSKETQATVKLGLISKTDAEEMVQLKGAVVAFDNADGMPPLSFGEGITPDTLQKAMSSQAFKKQYSNAVYFASGSAIKLVPSFANQKTIGGITFASFKAPPMGLVSPMPDNSELRDGAVGSQVYAGSVSPATSTEGAVEDKRRLASAYLTELFKGVGRDIRGASRISRARMFRQLEERYPGLALLVRNNIDAPWLRNTLERARERALIAAAAGSVPKTINAIRSASNQSVEAVNTAAEGTRDPDYGFTVVEGMGELPVLSPYQKLADGRLSAPRMAMSVALTSDGETITGEDLVIMERQLGRPLETFGKDYIDSLMERLSLTFNLRSKKKKEATRKIMQDLLRPIRDDSGFIALDGQTPFGKTPEKAFQFVAWLQANEGLLLDLSDIKLEDLSLRVEEPGKPIEQYRAKGVLQHEFMFRKVNDEFVGFHVPGRLMFTHRSPALGSIQSTQVARLSKNLKQAATYIHQALLVKIGADEDGDQAHQLFMNQRAMLLLHKLYEQMEDNTFQLQASSNPDRFLQSYPESWVEGLAKEVIPNIRISHPDFDLASRKAHAAGQAGIGFLATLATATNMTLDVLQLGSVAYRLEPTLVSRGKAGRVQIPGLSSRDDATSMLYPDVRMLVFNDIINRVLDSAKAPEFMLATALHPSLVNFFAASIIAADIPAFDRQRGDFETQEAYDQALYDWVHRHTVQPMTAFFRNNEIGKQLFERIVNQGERSFEATGTVFKALLKDLNAEKDAERIDEILSYRELIDKFSRLGVDLFVMARALRIVKQRPSDIGVTLKLVRDLYKVRDGKVETIYGVSNVNAEFYLVPREKDLPPSHPLKTFLTLIGSPFLDNLVPGVNAQLTEVNSHPAINKFVDEELLDLWLAVPFNKGWGKGDPTLIQFSDLVYYNKYVEAGEKEVVFRPEGYAAALDFVREMTTRQALAQMRLELSAGTLPLEERVISSAADDVALIDRYNSRRVALEQQPEFAENVILNGINFPTSSSIQVTKGNLSGTMYRVMVTPGVDMRRAREDWLKLPKDMQVDLYDLILRFLGPRQPDSQLLEMVPAEFTREVVDVYNRIDSALRDNPDLLGEKIPGYEGMTLGEVWRMYLENYFLGKKLEDYGLRTRLNPGVEGQPLIPAAMYTGLPASVAPSASATEAPRALAPTSTPAPAALTHNPELDSDIDKGKKGYQQYRIADADKKSYGLVYGKPVSIPIAGGVVEAFIHKLADGTYRITHIQSGLQLGDAGGHKTISGATKFLASRMANFPMERFEQAVREAGDIYATEAPVPSAAGEISSDSKGLLAALTNPTELAKKKGNLQESYPVEVRGQKFADAEAAFQSLKPKGKMAKAEYDAATDALMREILAAKFQQHPRLRQEVEKRGGKAWLETATHRAQDKNWGGTGRQSRFVAALADAYVSLAPSASATPAQETQADKAPVAESLSDEWSKAESAPALAPPAPEAKPAGGININTITEYKGLVVRREPGKVHPVHGGVTMAALRTDENGGLYISVVPSEMAKSFREKLWTKPRVKGITPLAENSFSTLNEWAEFIFEHEVQHQNFPSIKPKDGTNQYVANEEAINRAAARELGIEQKLYPGSQAPSASAPTAVGRIAAETTRENPVVLYSDGSDIKGTGLIGYGVWAEWGGKQYAISGTNETGEGKKLSERFPGAKFSNPTMEMLALAKGLEAFAGQNAHVLVRQDYKGAVNYDGLWQRAVQNAQRDAKPWKAKEAYMAHLRDRAVAAIESIEKAGGSVRLEWVRGHQTGSGEIARGNDMADKMAKSREGRNDFVQTSAAIAASASQALAWAANRKARQDMGIADNKPLTGDEVSHDQDRTAREVMKSFNGRWKPLAESIDNLLKEEGVPAGIRADRVRKLVADRKKKKQWPTGAGGAAFDHHINNMLQEKYSGEVPLSQSMLREMRQDVEAEIARGADPEQLRDLGYTAAVAVADVNKMGAVPVTDANGNTWREVDTATAALAASRETWSPEAKVQQQQQGIDADPYELAPRSGYHPQEGVNLADAESPINQPYDPETKQGRFAYKSRWRKQPPAEMVDGFEQTLSDLGITPQFELTLKDDNIAALYPSIGIFQGDRQTLPLAVTDYLVKHVLDESVGRRMSALGRTVDAGRYPLLALGRNFEGGSHSDLVAEELKRHLYGSRTLFSSPNNPASRLVRSLMHEIERGNLSKLLQRGAVTMDKAGELNLSYQSEPRQLVPEDRVDSPFPVPLSKSLPALVPDAGVREILESARDKREMISELRGLYDSDRLDYDTYRALLDSAVYNSGLTDPYGDSLGGPDVTVSIAAAIPPANTRAALLKTAGVPGAHFLLWESMNELHIMEKETGEFYNWTSNVLALNTLEAKVWDKEKKNRKRADGTERAPGRWDNAASKVTLNLEEARQRDDFALLIRNLVQYRDRWEDGTWRSRKAVRPSFTPVYKGDTLAVDREQKPVFEEDVVTLGELFDSYMSSSYRKKMMEEAGRTEEMMDPMNWAQQYADKFDADNRIINQKFSWAFDGQEFMQYRKNYFPRNAGSIRYADPLNQAIDSRLYELERIGTNEELSRLSNNEELQEALTTRREEMAKAPTDQMIELLDELLSPEEKSRVISKETGQYTLTAPQAAGWIQRKLAANVRRDLENHVRASIDVSLESVQETLKAWAPPNERKRDLATLALLAKLNRGPRFTEWASAEFGRTAGANDFEVYTTSQRLSENPAEWVRPQSYNIADIRKQYVLDTYNAALNKAMLSGFVTITDPEGRPLMMAMPTEGMDLDKNPIRREAWIKAAQIQSRAAKLEEPFDPTRDDLVGELIRVYNASRTRFPNRTTVKSPKAASIEEWTVFDNQSKMVLQQVIQVPFTETSAVFKALMSAVQWTKRLSVGFSAFFYVALAESAISASGIRRNLAVNLLTSKKFREQFANGVQEFKALREYYDPYAASRSRVLIESGLRSSGAGVAIDQPNTIVDVQMEQMTQWMRENKGQKEANWFKYIMTGDTSALNTWPGMGAWPGVSGKKWSDAMFGWFSAVKEYQSEMILMNQAIDNGLSVDSALNAPTWYTRRSAQYMNETLGGINWPQMVWTTPSVMAALNLSLFATNWTTAAIQSSGLGYLLQRVKVNGVPLGTNYAPGQAPMIGASLVAMYLVVMQAIPLALQAATYAAGQALGGDPDDTPFPWDNDPTRTDRIDVTPLMRHSPFYKGDPSGERRIYIQFAKQVHETGVLNPLGTRGWINEPYGQLMRKLSMPARYTVEMMTGQSPGSDWDLEFKGKGMLGWINSGAPGFEGLWTSRLGYAVQKVVPISVTQLIQNFEVAPLNFFAPTSRGLSKTAITAAMVQTLQTYASREDWRRIRQVPQARAKLDTLMPGLMRAAERNGYNAQQLLDSSRGRVLGELYKKMWAAINRDNVAEMNEAAAAIMRVGGQTSGLLQSLTARERTFGKPVTDGQKQMAVDALEQAYNGRF